MTVDPTGYPADYEQYMLWLRSLKYDTGRVIVTGSRTWANADRVRDTLDDVSAYLLRGYRHPEPLTLVHGHCRTGADVLADRAAAFASRWGSPERHPADWTRGKGAGFERNADMVQRGADACVAFVEPCGSAKCDRPKPHGSHGASHCAGLAEKAGIPTWRWTS